jgi:predicted house-cleaning NTP pyrophosphatase (Maf/HAM1 superfamily)
MDEPMIPPPRLLLASHSPRRQQLLRDAGFDFVVEPANINENEFPRHVTPSEVALHLARAKARVVAERFPEDVTLAARTRWLSSASASSASPQTPAMRARSFSSSRARRTS